MTKPSKQSKNRGKTVKNIKKPANVAHSPKMSKKREKPRQKYRKNHQKC